METCAGDHQVNLRGDLDWRLCKGLCFGEPDQAGLILSNIAEGFERNGDKEFIQFLMVAKGSCGEVRAQLFVALDQGYVDKHLFAEIESRLVETSRMISGLVKYLKQSDFKGSKFK